MIQREQLKKAHAEAIRMHEAFASPYSYDIPNIGDQIRDTLDELVPDQLTVSEADLIFSAWRSIYQRPS